ncbi:1,4-alpha-glucan branching protein GlgB [bacterium]|nr:1,4-alpha-glucan branching protein GlgB [bacterium]
MNETVTREEIARIVFGDHDDPFSVLGYQRIKLRGRGRTMHSVRAFVPDAEQMLLVCGDDGPVPMHRLHNAGFFEVVLDDPPSIIPYRLEAVYPDGSRMQMYDVYSFGPVMSTYDLHLIGEGTEEFIYHKLGAHLKTVQGVSGTYFAVWAPNARRVSLTGPFNRWNGRQHPMRKLRPSGVWEIFMPEIGPGEHYKYEIVFASRPIIMKADPYAFQSEVRPSCASIVTDLEKYTWGDKVWLDKRKKYNHYEKPLSIYEVHLGSWKQKPVADKDKDVTDTHMFLNYRELAHELVDYVTRLGYTHIELMPVTEHLLDASWGYQVTGYYAPTSRYGSPDDFKYFVDYCHQHEIGVLMDWVPAHFPRDYTALARFDGTALYEHLDPRRGFHPQWKTYIFNFGRNEVRNFLIGSALFWLKEYHLDGLRVDAVASMLYLDFSREQGQWLPNKYGGRENLEAVEFLQELNVRVHKLFPDVLMFAEESSTWPMVTRPVYSGGLGFDLKWNMGWMHDTLKYMALDPIFRKFQHNILTWSLFYAFTENFVLPFSHDEVVHLKKSMFNKMPGDYWKMMANLRLCYAYHYSHPGKKLLFMGGEFGQWHEWSEKQELQWELLDREPNRKLQTYIAELNQFYRKEPALFESDFERSGFQWIDFADADQSVISFIRRGKKQEEQIVWVFNFTPLPRHDYRIGFPRPGTYREIFNSDLDRYGGSDVRNPSLVETEAIAWHKSDCSVRLALPPLAAIAFKLVPPVK